MTSRQLEKANTIHDVVVILGIIIGLAWLAFAFGGCVEAERAGGVSMPTVAVQEAGGEGYAKLTVNGTQVEVRTEVRLLVTEDDTIACPALTVRIGAITIDGVLPDSAPECIYKHGALPVATAEQSRPF